jgi:hypothetical protein
VNVGIVDADVLVEQADKGKHIFEIVIMGRKVENRPAKNFFERRYFPPFRVSLDSNDLAIQRCEEAGELGYRSFAKLQRSIIPCTRSPSHPDVGGPAEIIQTP